MRLAEIFETAIGSDAPIAFTAYDGSRAGDPDAPVRVDVRSPLALSYLASAPGELGLSRAYVSGSLDIVGDMYVALRSMMSSSLTIPPKIGAEMVLKMGASRLWWPVRHPAAEARVRGRRHSKRRDQEAIAHHYDVSNRFYEWVLGPSMTYTCACYPSASSTLEEAQAAKYELVAQKLALEPGMRLLDVGCGWGGMVMHAAAEHGVKALGVTLSRNQAEWAQAEIERRGLGGLAEVRHCDYRDAPESEFDAISSIGLTEHIGRANLRDYFASLQTRLRPEGRLLNHCITQPRTPVKRLDPFIARYVFPDGQLHAVGHLITVMNDNGFEIRHEENLREHYALTLHAWGRNLEEHWDEAVAEVGVGRARVWRLYMAACALGFERDNIQLHQVLGVRLTGHGGSGFPLRGWR